MDDTPQPSARDHPSGEQSSDPQYSTQVEEIPGDRENQFEKYYNRKSRLIVLSGPRGPMLARYTGRETPEHGRHRFLVTYPDYRADPGRRRRPGHPRAQDPPAREFRGGAPAPSGHNSAWFWGRFCRSGKPPARNPRQKLA
jgi:hypothetical protein